VRLSVCLIARNEEHNLPRALQSTAGVAHEVIVTDTGSSDRTPQIAEELGARVFHFPWCDDFSAARNHAVSQAEGDWILWLDADEELLPSSEEALLRSLENDLALAYLVSRQDLADADRPDHFTQMWQLRLFRNLPELRFRGRCHPDFVPPIQETADRRGQSVLPSGIEIRHYGYVGALRQEKLLRGARLLELELKDRPGQLYYLIEYGRTLLLLNDSRAREVLEEAVGQVLEHREGPSPPIPLAACLFEYLLQLPKKRLPHGLSPKEVRRLALKWFPRGAPLIWIMAQQAFEREDFEDAERLLRALVQMGADNSYDRHVSFNPRIVMEDALLNLGVCLVRQAKLGEAGQWFEQLIQQGKRVKEAEANLKTINRLKKRYAQKKTRSRKGKRRKKRR
jgi:hypothetical protein